MVNVNNIIKVGDCFKYNRSLGVCNCDEDNPFFICEYEYCPKKVTVEEHESFKELEHIKKNLKIKYYDLEKKDY